MLLKSDYRGVSAAEERLGSVHRDISALVDFNTEKVLEAFIEERIGEHHLQGTTGYGHNDLGREALESVFARIFKAEKALVRPHFASGTHAIAAGLFGLLRPGDELLSVAGDPYDTLEEVIGVRGENQGSLKEWGVQYRAHPLTPEGRVDLEHLGNAISEKTRVALIQRSRGYAWRPSIDIAEMEIIIRHLKSLKSDLLVLVDNCYGEFTERMEPTEIGADLVVGSLIKNPGGGLTPTGGYAVGTKECVEKTAARLYAPGMLDAYGATMGFNRLALQGLFMAPHVVGQALMTATLAAQIYQDLGYPVSPEPTELRTDIIQAIRFDDPKKLVAFCQQIQRHSPVESYVKPEPSGVTGYDDQVVMAAGTFTEGSTIELSADGPLRPPYIAYLQGSLNYSHGKLALAKALHLLVEG